MVIEHKGSFQDIRFGFGRNYFKLRNLHEVTFAPIAQSLSTTFQGDAAIRKTARLSGILINLFNSILEYEYLGQTRNAEVQPETQEATGGLQFLGYFLSF